MLEVCMKLYPSEISTSDPNHIRVLVGQKSPERRERFGITLFSNNVGRIRVSKNREFSKIACPHIPPNICIRIKLGLKNESRRGNKQLIWFYHNKKRGRGVVLNIGRIRDYEEGVQ